MITLCPHCDSKAIVRTSTQISTLVRECTFSCLNWECGHTFVSCVNVVRTLSPSAIPNPKIYIPLSSHIKKDQLMTQLKKDVPYEAQGELDV